jgi:hypothetical protein
VPGDLVVWIESFCNGRKASVVVGDYESPISIIEHAGIPQASPLSPILYVFYNANTKSSFCNCKGLRVKIASASILGPLLLSIKLMIKRTQAVF